MEDPDKNIVEEQEAQAEKNLEKTDQAIEKERQEPPQIPPGMDKLG